MTISISSIEFIEDTGRYMLIAEFEPVMIDSFGEQFVLLSYDKYQDMLKRNVL